VWRLSVRDASTTNQALEQTLARSRHRVTDELRGSGPAQEQAPVTAPGRPAVDVAGLAPPQFHQIGSKPARRRGRGSAARRAEATVLSYALVLGTALSVAAYLAGR